MRRRLINFQQHSLQIYTPFTNSMTLLSYLPSAMLRCPMQAINKALMNRRSYCGLDPNPSEFHFNKPSTTLFVIVTLFVSPPRTAMYARSPFSYENQFDIKISANKIQKVV